jgi:hypothetical protein
MVAEVFFNFCPLNLILKCILVNMQFKKLVYFVTEPEREREREREREPLMLDLEWVLCETMFFSFLEKPFVLDGAGSIFL